MNLQAESDFVVKVKTPTSFITQNVTLGDNKFGNTSENVEGYTPARRHSSPSLSYSDSFDSDSPLKVSISKDTSTEKKRSRRYRLIRRRSRISKDISVMHKPSEATQRLLEASRIKINELVSENCDLRRRLTQQGGELRTVQSQNKIQARFLTKANGRDAEVPTIMARFSAEIHSLQEQLRSKRDAAEAAQRTTREVETKLARAKHRIEKLRSLCDEKKLYEREELMKRLTQIQEQLDAEKKKSAELERSAELATKRHIHELSIEVNKYRALKQSHAQIVAELKDLKLSLKEKTKVLEMQNIYSSKRAVRAPHRLSRSFTTNQDQSQANVDVPQYHLSMAGDQERVTIDTAPLRTGRVAPSFNVEKIASTTKHRYQRGAAVTHARLRAKRAPQSVAAATTITTASLVKIPTAARTTREDPVTAVGHQKRDKRQHSVLFYGDTPSETTSEREETCASSSRGFSVEHERVMNQFTGRSCEYGARKTSVIREGYSPTTDTKNPAEHVLQQHQQQEEYQTIQKTNLLEKLRLIDDEGVSSTAAAHDDTNWSRSACLISKSVEEDEDQEEEEDELSCSNTSSNGNETSLAAEGTYAQGGKRDSVGEISSYDGDHSRMGTKFQGLSRPARIRRSEMSPFHFLGFSLHRAANTNNNQPTSSSPSTPLLSPADEFELIRLD